MLKLILIVGLVFAWHYVANDYAKRGILPRALVSKSTMAVSVMLAITWIL